MAPLNVTLSPVIELVPVRVCEPPEKINAVPVASKEPLWLPPPDIDNVPVCTSTVPELLNATRLNSVMPVPAVFWKVPALLTDGAPPLCTRSASVCASKTVPEAMFSWPTPPGQMSPVPVQVAARLLLTMRLTNLGLVPPSSSAPLQLVVPVPLMVPPVQLVVPLTSNVPVPVRVPLLRVRSVMEVFELSVQVPPLPIATSSLAPGTLLGFQLVAVNQLPAPTFQL